MSFIHSMIIFITIIFFSLNSDKIFGIRRRHVINFRSPNLYPVSLAWDPTSKRFIVGSSRRPILLSVSESGTANTLVNDRSLPVKSFFPSITVDPIRQRLLAVVHSHSDPTNTFLAAYELYSPHRRIFLASLHDTASDSVPSALGVTFDFFGNGVVTNPAGNFIWKVDLRGRPSVFSACPVYKETLANQDKPYNSGHGLNGIVYNSQGYFLVAQSNTGKLYKVDDEYGVAKGINTSKELTAIDGLAVKSDGVLLALSKKKLHFVNSEDWWNTALVFDEVALDAKRSPSSVTVGREWVYVLYGHVEEGMRGNSQRKEFSIAEIGPKVQKDISWMVYLLVGYGSAYFLMYKLQTQRFITDMNKKTV